MGWRFGLLLAILIGTGFPLASRAQDDGDLGEDTGAQLGTSRGEVTLKLERFGVVDRARPGDWVGVRIAVTDASEQVRSVLIRMEGLDRDGDRPLVERVIVSNPGVTVGTWLYFRIPFSFGGGSTLNVSAYEAIERDGGRERGELDYRAGRRLGSAVFAPSTVLPPEVGLIGVVGRRMMGLSGYRQAFLISSSVSPTGHEATEVVSGIDPAHLPDRWQGLMQFDVIVWGDADPLELRADHATSIREWVERGGHLVIVLPRAGQSWMASNSLTDLLPRVQIERVEEAPWEPYRSFVSSKSKDKAPLPAVGTVHVFHMDENAAAGEAIRLMEGRDGECIATRRVLGAGMVTVIGLDIGSRALEAQGLPETDVFWHRILGRRGEMLSAQDLRTSVSVRTRRAIDTDVGKMINQTGRAEVGVLLGLAVFILYWVIAGPAGYAILKKKGMVRHSWVAYVLTAGVFTAIAWGGAMAIRPAKVEVRHVTLLDHVYGQGTQRARMWLSLLIPGYGEATIRIGQPDSQSTKPGEEQFHNVLAPWDPYGQSGGIKAFPDARGYSIDSKSSMAMTVPTRSTSKEMRADWAGGPNWDMPRPVASQDGTTGIKLLENRKLSGSLVHGMPGPLHDIIIVVNRGQVSHRDRGGRVVFSDAAVYAIDGEWVAGDVLDLGQATRTPERTRERTRDQTQWSATSYFQKITEDLSRDGGMNIGGMDTPDIRSATLRLTAVGFLSQLDPPRRDSRSGSWDGKAAVLRAETHGYDLGKWLMQPCVIIVGHIGGKTEPAESPVPVFVNERRAPTTGRTVVRWIYMLPDNPPAFPEESILDGAGGDGDSNG